MMNNIGPYGTFATYAIDNFLMTALVAIFIPETKAKSLEEIERYFRKEIN